MIRIGRIGIEIHMLDKVELDKLVQEGSGVKKDNSAERNRSVDQYVDTVTGQVRSKRAQIAIAGYF